MVTHGDTVSFQTSEDLHKMSLTDSQLRFGPCSRYHFVVSTYSTAGCLVWVLNRMSYDVLGIGPRRIGKKCRVEVVVALFEDGS